MGNVLVYVETSGGQVAPISFELLGAARTLAAAWVEKWKLCSRVVVTWLRSLGPPIR